MTAALALAGAMAGCVRTSTAAAKPADSPPFFALRLAFKDSAAGRARAQYGDATVFLAPDVLLSDDDLLSVRTTIRPDQGLLLHVRHRPETAQRLAAATGTRLGDQLAVLLDSRIWSLARIASPIGEAGSLTIATSARGDDAERIALQIRSRWPMR